MMSHRRFWLKAIMMARATLMALVGLLPSAALAVGGVWSPAPSMNTARGMHAATLLLNGKVLVTGGYNSSSGYLTSAEIYDPASNTWSSTRENKDRQYDMQPGGWVRAKASLRFYCLQSTVLCLGDGECRSFRCGAIVDPMK